MSESPSSVQILARAQSGSSCRVSLLRGASSSDSALVRCALRGQLAESGAKRRKVLVVVLDRSGSMAGAMWRRLVEGVASVVTDELLADTHTSICLVVYSDDAREIWMPASNAELRDLLLSREYSPQGGTSFKAAFQRTQQVVDRELKAHLNSDVNATDIDIAILVFTDGEDTSVKGRAGEYGVRLVDKEASAAAARKAGDSFRKALLETGCTTYICIAAFGADHDPDMCQYLSDRYYFINRGEVLSEVLAGGLGSLLNSAGQCSLRVSMPTGATLEEPVPEILPLDSHGRLEYHIWLRVPTGCSGALAVDVEVANTSVLGGLAHIGSETIPELDTFEHHVFQIDLVALTLRRIARELCGRRPSGDELTRLRERLTEAKERLQLTRDAAGVASGQLRGRAALRERVSEIEMLRDRLSYALGQFDERDTNDERKIGSTAIDAILRDAGQHVPEGPVAAALVRQADVLAELPEPEQLSAYGKEYTSDLYSCCNAFELACQGDALFFQLTNPKLSPHGGFTSATDGIGLISFEAFTLLSRGGKQPIKGTDATDGFTHVGFPLYCTEGHFLRALALMPNALRALSPKNVYAKGVSELQLLSLLGRSFVASPAKTEAELTALLHKVRAVHALLSMTFVNEEALLSEAIHTAERFVAEPESRSEVLDLFIVLGAGLMLEFPSEDWFSQLGDALTSECLLRRIQHSMRNATDSARLCLACSLLGPADSDDAWLDAALPCPEATEHASGDLNPFDAPGALEALESSSPCKAAPSPDGAASLLAILSVKSTDNLPRASEWSTMQTQLRAWGKAVTVAKGASNMWACLDALMLEDEASHKQTLQDLIAALRVSPTKSLRNAFPDVAAIASIATSACLGDIRHGENLRLSVAAELRALVEKRKMLVRKYPIVGASFPMLDEHSKESVRDIWGSPANPTDLALHHKAYLRVWRRTMGCRITTTTKEALTDKEYRKRGGRFVFPSPLDTFIRGLHRRTADLHKDWIERLQKSTSGDQARQEAVEEMLLRLRWDDSDETARKKLSKIVARIWDDLEGIDVSGYAPLSSALWLDDDMSNEDGALEATSATCTLKNTSEESAAISPSTELIQSTEAEDSNVHNSKATLVEASSAQANPTEPTQLTEAEDTLVQTAPTTMLVEATSSPSPSDESPKRVARDGNAYTQKQFCDHYGDIRGASMWDEANESERDAKVKAPGMDATSDGNLWETRAAAARGKMDAGLQQAFDGLAEDVHRSIEQFAANQRANSRMKLPLDLTAKERKALHLWAEMNRVEHQSFGYRGRRRLHLSVGNVPVGRDDSFQDDDNSEDEDYDSEGVDDYEHED